MAVMRVSTFVIYMVDNSVTASSLTKAHLFAWLLCNVFHRETFSKRNITYPSAMACCKGKFGR